MAVCSQGIDKKDSCRLKIWADEKVDKVWSIVTSWTEQSCWEFCTHITVPWRESFSSLEASAVSLTMTRHQLFDQQRTLLLQHCFADVSALHQKMKSAYHFIFWTHHVRALLICYQHFVYQTTILYSCYSTQMLFSQGSTAPQPRPILWLFLHFCYLFCCIFLKTYNTLVTSKIGNISRNWTTALEFY